MSIRSAFPEAGSDYQGGTSDGYVYTTAFAGSSLDATYEMVCAFLAEEGYKDVPIPKDAKELSFFKIPVKNKQILLFEDNGYVHNPLKIKFSSNGRQKTTLIIEIYNEQDPQHLLKFHGKVDR